MWIFTEIGVGSQRKWISQNTIHTWGTHKSTLNLQTYITLSSFKSEYLIISQSIPEMIMLMAVIRECKKKDYKMYY